jgi:hypothetical protein
MRSTVDAEFAMTAPDLVHQRVPAPTICAAGSRPSRRIGRSGAVAFVIVVRDEALSVSGVGQDHVGELLERS